MPVSSFSFASRLASQIFAEFDVSLNSSSSLLNPFLMYPPALNNAGQSGAIALSKNFDSALQSSLFNNKLFKCALFIKLRVFFNSGTKFKDSFKLIKSFGITLP